MSGWKDWHDSNPEAPFGAWLEERCFARRSACASTAAALLFLAANGLSVSRTTLDHWLAGRRYPDAHHLMMLFEIFVIPDSEREVVSHLVMRSRASSMRAGPDAA